MDKSLSFVFIIGYLVVFVMLFYFYRDARSRYNIPLAAMVIFYAFCLVSAIVVYLVSPLFPTVFGITRVGMRVLSYLIWSILMFVILEIMIRYFQT